MQGWAAAQQKLQTDPQSSPGGLINLGTQAWTWWGSPAYGGGALSFHGVPRAVRASPVLVRDQVQGQAGSPFPQLQWVAQRPHRRGRAPPPVMPTPSSTGAEPWCPQRWALVVTCHPLFPSQTIQGPHSSLNPPPLSEVRAALWPHPSLQPAICSSIHCVNSQDRTASQGLRLSSVRQESVWLA